MRLPLIARRRLCCMRNYLTIKFVRVLLAIGLRCGVFGCLTKLDLLIKYSLNIVLE